MLECLILGDSIAVGTKQFAPTECVAYAKGGWNSWQWNRDYLTRRLDAKTVIISLGSNDHAGVKTYQELKKLRVKVQAQRVFWILPAIKPNIQDTVRRVAREHGDTIVTIPALQPDGIHPSWRGYKGIVKETLNR